MLASAGLASAGSAGAAFVVADTPGTSRLGDVYLYAIAPVVIFLALVVWIAMTLLTSRHRWSRRTPTGTTGLPHRGPVQGGVILADPSRRTPRDAVPSGARREPAGRPGEDAREPACEARPEPTGGRAASRRGGTRTRRRSGRRRRT